MNNRCSCGARIMWCDARKIKDGVEVFIYICGVCGKQLEFVYDTDPTKT